MGEAFAKADAEGEEGFGKLKPSRLTVSQRKEKERREAEAALAAAAGNGEEAGAAEGEVAVDPVSLSSADMLSLQIDTATAVEEEEDTPPSAFDLASPVSVIPKLPPDFYANLSSAKWKDRKELALEPLLDLVKTPKLEPGDNYEDLLRALAGRMTDANVVCVALAANCIEAIALGLREAFGRYKSAVVAPMLARTKEKKASVLDALGAALDAAFASVSAPAPPSGKPAS